MGRKRKGERKSEKLEEFIAGVGYGRGHGAASAVVGGRMRIAKDAPPAPTVA